MCVLIIKKQFLKDFLVCDARAQVTKDLVPICCHAIDLLAVADVPASWANRSVAGAYPVPRFTWAEIARLRIRRDPKDPRSS